MDIDISPSGKVISVYNDNGISIYDHKSGQFDNWTYGTSTAPEGPKHSISKVLIENDSLLYLIANFEGVYKMNIPQKTFEKLDLPLTRIPIDLAKNTTSLNGNLLFCRGGLQLYNEKTKAFSPLTKVGGGDIEIMGDVIYVMGYSKMIHAYHVKSQQSYTYEAHFPGVIRGAILFNDQVWMGTAEGISVLNQTTGNVKEVLRADQTNSNLPGTFVYDIFQDSEDHIWVSTDGGLSIYDPKEERFTSSDEVNAQSSYLINMDDGRLLSMDFYSRDIKRTGNMGLKNFMSFPPPLEHPISFIGDGKDELLLCFNGLGQWNKNANRIELLDCPFTESRTRGLIDVIANEKEWLGIYRHWNEMIIWDRINNTTDTVPLHYEPRKMIQVNPEEV